MPAQLNNLSDMKAQIEVSGRLVLLRHSVPETFRQISGRGDHFDLMLEPGADSKLWTWAIDRNILAPGKDTRRCTAQRLADHRRLYLDFEGPISGERGYVQQLFSGSFVTQKGTSDLKVRIEADRSSPSDISGELKLVQADNGPWEIEFQPE